MARFTDSPSETGGARFGGTGLGQPGGLPPEAPIPTPAPRATLLPPSKPGYGHNMTLAALMERQKQIAEQQNALQQSGGGGTIMGGIGMLANSFVNALADRRAARAEEEGRAEVSEAFKTFDPATGMLSPEAMDAVMRRAPDVGMDLYKAAMALKASQGKQDVYGPVITGEAATRLGLDGSKSYQLNTTTGQYDPVGGGGGDITIGTGEKLTESLIKDTTFYPGAVNANLELEELDQYLTDTPGALANFVTGGNFLTSPEYRQAQTAGDAWIMNVLRRESGATIGEKELTDNRRIYLPQPGDDAETIAYKRRLREEKTATLRYGLEAAAPETLKKIDAATAAARAAREERRRKKRDAANPPADPAKPDATTPPAPDATTTPPAEQPGTLPYISMPDTWPADKGWPDAATWKKMSQADQQAFIDAAKGAR